jgi:hypothetical protein
MRPKPTSFLNHWEKAIEASKTPGTLYLYNSVKVKKDLDRFFKEDRDAIPMRSVQYRPVPYYYQYDLEMHLFLNYYQLIREEVNRLKKMLPAVKGDAAKQEISNEIVKIKMHGVTGVPRAVHLLHAAEIRWPTHVDDKGRHIGQMVRNPWTELIFGEIARMQSVIVYGGGGQGKTHIFVAVLAMVFDHFQGTLMGAQCTFSTINKVKMERVTWPRIQRLYENTASDISLYAGTGRIGSDFTIFRTGTKSTGSVLRGVLVGASVNDNKVIDKLTGVHGHDAYAYLIDELQSTREAPIEASSNFLATCPQDMGFLFGSGNWNTDEDQLGRNTVPINGWSSIEFDRTTVYDSFMITGRRCACIYLSNEHSPGMDKDGADKWGHMLPTREKKHRLFEDEERAKKTEPYKRFWIGCRDSLADEYSFCNTDLISEGACDRMPQWKGPVNFYLSFDSAPAGVDRSPVLTFADGIDALTGKRVIHFEGFDLIHLEGQSHKYYSLMTDNVVRIAKTHGVTKDKGIVLDWNNLSSFPELLSEKGYDVYACRYQIAMPDGKRKHPNTGAIDPPIIIDESEEGIRYAHTECVDHITFGAFVMKYFLQTGRITGFSDKLFSSMDSSEHRTFEEEFCMRRFDPVNSGIYGERKALKDKKKFKREMGFSTDFLDCMLQAMLLVFLHKNFNPFFMDCPTGPQVPNKGLDESMDDDEEDSEFYKRQMGLIWGSNALSN